MLFRSGAAKNRLAMVLGPPGRLLSPLLLLQLPLRTGVDASALRPVDAVRQLACPVLVIGGERDAHTTAAETRQIFEAAPLPRQLWMVEGAAHVDFHAHARVEYEKRVGEFLEANLR